MLLQKPTTYTLLFLCLSSIVTHWVHAAVWDLECSYASAFQACKSAQTNGNTRTLTNPLCTSNPSNEAILDQIILDVKFKEIDTEAELYLEQLVTQKDAYFWPNAQSDVNRAIDDVTKNFWIEWVYYKQYKDLCNGWILAERAKCTGSIPNLAAAPLLDQWFNQSACMELVNFKVDSYRYAAYEILGQNKYDVEQVDTHKKYVKEQRTKYDALMSLLQTIVSHMGRLARWVTHWTPQPLQ